MVITSKIMEIKVEEIKIKQEEDVEVKEEPLIAEEMETVDWMEVGYIKSEEMIKKEDIQTNGNALTEEEYFNMREDFMRHREELKIKREENYFQGVVAIKRENLPMGEENDFMIEEDVLSSEENGLKRGNLKIKEKDEEVTKTQEKEAEVRTPFGFCIMESVTDRFEIVSKEEIMKIKRKIGDKRKSCLEGKYLEKPDDDDPFSNNFSINLSSDLEKVLHNTSTNGFSINKKRNCLKRNSHQNSDILCPKNKKRRNCKMKKFSDMSSEGNLSNPKQFMCEICRKYFMEKVNLQLHMVYHLDEKLFYCEECQKSFGNNLQLRRHMTCHNSNFIL